MVLTAASQAVNMGLGAVLALLVLVLFGTDDQTDAFFAAYGVFAFLGAVAQGLRISLPSLLSGSGGHERPFDRLFGGVLVLAVVAAVPMVLLRGLTASLLVGSLGTPAVATTSTSLLLLWVAGAMQLVGGCCAASLAVQGRLVVPAVAYGGGALLAIALTVTFANPLGIMSVSVGVACGAVVTGGVLLSALVWSGWRPVPQRVGLRAVWEVVAGSAAYFGVQASYLFSLAMAARFGEGAVTLYAYAFFGALFLVGTTSGAAGIVLAGFLSQAWDLRLKTLEPTLVSVTRVGLLMALPALAVAAVLGDWFLQAAVLDTIPAADSRQLVITLLCLSGLVAFWIAGTVPLVAAYAQERHTVVAWVTAGVVVVHALLSSLAAGTGRLEVLALAASSSQAVLLGGLVVTVYRRDALRPTGLLAAYTMGLMALAAVTFGAGLVLGHLLGGGAWQIAAAVVGSLSFYLVVRQTMSGTWLDLMALAGRSNAPWRPGSLP